MCCVKGFTVYLSAWHVSLLDYFFCNPSGWSWLNTGLKRTNMFLSIYIKYHQLACRRKEFCELDYVWNKEINNGTEIKIWGAIIRDCFPEAAHSCPSGRRNEKAQVVTAVWGIMSSSSCPAFTTVPPHNISTSGGLLSSSVMGFWTWVLPAAQHRKVCPFHFLLLCSVFRCLVMSIWLCVTLIALRETVLNDLILGKLSWIWRRP